MALEIKDGILIRCSQNETKVTIPDGVTTICAFAFQWCIRLTEVIIPDSVTSIGSSAFARCSSLTKVNIPDSVTSIGVSTFAGCSSLEEIVIPDSITRIGNAAFAGCSNLTEIIIPKSVESIGENAFWRCDALSVIRRRQSDPKFYRDYGKERNLTAELQKTLRAPEMQWNCDYMTFRNTMFKHLFLMLDYLRTHDELAAAYIRKHLGDLMQECIPAGDIVFISDLTKSKLFFTRENIDDFISLAQKHGQYEIVVLLLRYIEERLGVSKTKLML